MMEQLTFASKFRAWMPSGRQQRKKLAIVVAIALAALLALVLLITRESDRSKIHKMIRVLNEGQKFDRELAIDELKLLPREKVFPALVQALPGKFEGEFWGETGDYARELKYSYVAKALLALKAPVDQSFVSMLQDKDSERRYYAAWLAGLLQDPVVIPALARLLDDAPGKIQRKAMESLLLFPQPEASKLLVGILQRGPRHSLYPQAAASLCAVPRQGERALWQPLLRQGDPKVRIGLACVLAAQKKPENDPLLETLAQDPVAAVRLQAVNGLYEIANAQALLWITRQGRRDSAWPNRLRYVELLCRAGAAAQRLPLLRYLDDDYAVVDKVTRDGRKTITELSYPVRKAAFTCLEQADLAPKRAVLAKQIIQQVQGGKTTRKSASQPASGGHYAPPPASSGGAGAAPFRPPISWRGRK